MAANGGITVLPFATFPPIELITMKFHFTCLTLLLIFVAFSCGCNKNPPLKGKVTYDDGTPLTAGFLNFSSEKSMSRAKIRPDGTYTVGTLKETDGIPAGTYKVYISGAEEAIVDGKANQSKRVDSMGNPVQTMGRYRKLVGVEYMSASTTPITCEVPAEKNQFDITIIKPDHLK